MNKYNTFIPVVNIKMTSSSDLWITNCLMG